MAVVREDVVKLTFEIDDKGMVKAEGSLEALLNLTQTLGGSKGTGRAEDGFDDAARAAKKFGDTDLGKLTSGLNNIVKSAGQFTAKVGGMALKGLTAGVAAGAAGIAALGTQAVKSYAEYEQLIGGVDTLFKDSAGTMLKQANDAYKTAGMSANDYMANVTSFSASLISSVGGDTAKAASLADQAIISMADNANKMGSDLTSLTDAYKGFSRGQFQLLDNLKLGYGGTKEEMQRLLKDAQKLTGQKYDISNFADITEAIHAIQVEMGIAGTTSKEASETIQGSALAMKAAWTNFIGGMANEDADFDQLVDNLIGSVVTFSNNLIPRIKKMAPRLIRGLSELMRNIGKELPGLMADLAPSLISGGIDLVKGLLDSVVKSAPKFHVAGMKIIKAIYKGFTGEEMSGEMFQTLTEKINQALDAIKKITAGVWDFAKKIFAALGPALVWLGDLALDAFTWIGDNIEWLLPVLGSLLGALMAFTAVSKVTSVLKGFMGLFSKKGAAGGAGGGGGLTGGLFSLKPGQVLKGLANIGIIVVGLGALAALIMWASPYIAELTDAGSLGMVAAAIVGTGLIGSGLAWLSSLVGAIPITTVLTGLANIAAALLGFTLIVEAFGLLSEIPGFDEFMQKGGQVLVDICGIIGEMAGAIVGKFAEGVTSGLPGIGQNLADFATNAQPAFDAFANMNSSGLGDFVLAFGALIAVLTGEKILSIFTGGIDYAGLGTNLNTMATNLSGFFTTISDFDDTGFEKATALFDCLAGITSLPTEGGIVGWFEGEVDYAKMAMGLRLLSGAGVKSFFTMVAGLDEAAFTNAAKFFDCLAGVKGLPTEGGIKSWFTGTIAYDSIAAGLKALTSEDMIAAMNTLSGVPATAFTAVRNLFNALAGVSALPKDGGIFDWFTGTETESLTAVASALPDVATHIATFFSKLDGITDFSLIKNLFDTLGNIEIDADAASKGFLGLGTSDFEAMGSGLSSFATNAATFFTTVKDVPPDTMSSFFDALGKAGDLPAKLEEANGVMGTTLVTMIENVRLSLKTLNTNIDTLLGNCAAAISNKATAFQMAGVDIMNGLNAGMLSMKTTLLVTAQGIASSISKTIDDAMDINSPSRVTFKSGAYIGLGLAKGMQYSIPEVKVAAREVSSATIPYVGSYSPESSASYYSGGNSEYTTVSPSFNLTISGTTDDREMARKVKRYVSEAIRETFESLERKGHAIREV